MIHESLKTIPLKEQQKIAKAEFAIFQQQNGVECITVPLEYYLKIMTELNQRRGKKK
jgi:hypothetical protein